MDEDLILPATIVGEATATPVQHVALMVDTPVGDPQQIALWARGRNRIEGKTEFHGEISFHGTSAVELHPVVRAMFNALVAPQNKRQELAIAVLLGDDDAALALVDKVKEELGR